jgi:hypothetical protein
VSGFPAEGVDWRDIGGSFYNSLGHDVRGAALAVEICIGLEINGYLPAEF